jgi:hypothetical protein
MTTDIEARLARLEAESEIRRLKARYLNSCDAKDVPAIRACFTPDAKLDYGPLGKFGPDGMIEVFTRIAVSHPIIDSHQGHNGEIELTGETTATGRWSLAFATFDPESGTFRCSAGFYHDEYVRTDAGWRIAKCTHLTRLAFAGKVEAGSLEVTHNPA